MGEKHACNTHEKRMLPPRLENNLTEELEPIREVGGDKEVELSEGEGGRVAFPVAPMERDVTESPYAQEGPVEVHYFRHGMFSLRLSFGMTGQTGLLTRWPGVWCRRLSQSG